MMAKRVKNKQCFFLLVLSVALLVGCSVVKKPFELKAQLMDYAEVLYKRQNQATQQVMALLEEDISAEEEEAFSAAELHMYDACHLLNEVAVLEMEGKSMGLNFQRQVQASLSACEQRVQDMELLLNNFTKTQ